MTYPTRLSLSVTVGGHDITSHLNLGTDVPGKLETVSVLSHQIDTLTFDVYNISSIVSYFKEWAEVIVTNTGTGVRLFGGFLQIPSLTADSGGTRLDGEIQCSDYTCLLDHIKVKELFIGYTDAAMLVALFAKYLPEISTTTYVQTLKTWPALTLNNITLRQAIDKLAQGAGCDWYIDYNKNLHFFYGTSAMAPFGLSDAPDLVNTFPYTTFVLNLDGTGVINRVTINGGTYLSDPQYHYLQGTGQDTVIYLPGGPWAAAPGNANLLVWRNDGTAVTPVWTAMNVLLSGSPVNPNDVVFDTANSVLTQLAAWPLLPNAVQIYGCYAIPSLVRSFTDQASYAYYGRYFDAVINDTTITDKQSALIAAIGLMSNNSMGGQQVTCTTMQPGLRAGMTTPVTNALYGLSGLTLQVQKATGTIMPGGYCSYDLELGVYHQNLIDMLIALARNSQPIPDWQAEVELADYLQTTETVAPITDSGSAPVATAGPYYWGAAVGPHKPLVWSLTSWGGASTKSFILKTDGGKLISADHGGDLILCSY